MTGQEARDDEREALARYPEDHKTIGGNAAQRRAFLAGVEYARKHPEPSRDDEREALKAILWEWLGPIEADGDEMGAFADAILAAGYRKHPEPEITDAEVARLQGVIAEVRKAWWTATEYNDAGNVVYTDDIEAAMDSIWAAIAEETLGVPVGEGEQG